MFPYSVFSPVPPDKNKRGKGYIHVIPHLTDDLQPLAPPSQRFTVHEIFADMVLFGRCISDIWQTIIWRCKMGIKPVLII